MLRVVRKMSTSTGMTQVDLTKPIEKLVREKLTQTFAPTYFEVVNESYKHNVPTGSESHFKVVVVSKEFDGKTLVQRHRMVNHSLGEELKTSIHALSILAKTPEQWEQDSSVQKTPNCLGGH